MTHKLANLYQVIDHSAKAELLYQSAITIFEKTLPLDHLHLMRVWENYAGLLDQLGRPAEAAELRIQAQAIR